MVTINTMNTAAGVYKSNLAFIPTNVLSFVSLGIVLLILTHNRP